MATPKPKPDYVYRPVGTDEATAEFRYNRGCHRYSLRSTPGASWKPAPGASGIAGSWWPEPKPRNIKRWVAVQTLEYAFPHLAFKDGKLFYRDAEVTADSLKTIYEDSLTAHETAFEEAASVGTKVHEWAERYWRNRPAAVAELATIEDERIKQGAAAIIEWAEQHHVLPIGCEEYVYSLKHWYCGIIDLRATVDGESTLVDVKTSNYLSISHAVQLGGYLLAAPHEWGLRRVGILKVDKDTGLPLWVDLTDQAVAIEEAFLNLLALAHAKNSIEEPLVAAARRR